MNKKRLEAYFLAEMENVRRSVGLLQGLLKTTDGPPQTAHLAAIAVFLHNIYNGFENSLKRLLQLHGIKVDKTDRWHQNLLATSRERGWIDGELKKRLDGLLSLRHAFVHSYVFNIPWNQLQPLASSAGETVDLFEKQISSLFQDSWTSAKTPST